MASYNPNYAANVEPFSKLVEAMGDYNLKTAQGELAMAQADVLEAKAKREALGNEELELRMQRLNRQIVSLNTAQRKAAAQLKSVQDYIHHVSELENLGRTNRWIFDAVDQLFVILDRPQVTVRVMTAPVPAAACPNTNFHYNNEAPASSAAVPAFPGGNLSDLLDFLKENHLQFVKFRAAHLAVLSALAELSTAAEERAAEVDRKIADLRDHSIASLPTPAGNDDNSISSKSGTQSPGDP
jgi:hypothetical protein